MPSLPWWAIYTQPQVRMDVPPQTVFLRHFYLSNIKIPNTENQYQEMQPFLWCIWSLSLWDVGTGLQEECRRVCSCGLRNLLSLSPPPQDDRSRDEGAIWVRAEDRSGSSKGRLVRYQRRIRTLSATWIETIYIEFWQRTWLCPADVQKIWVTVNSKHRDSLQTLVWLLLALFSEVCSENSKPD